MKSTSELTDEELKAELSSFGFTAGPITDTTRGILHKKLGSFRNGSGVLAKTKASGKKTRTETPTSHVKENASDSLRLPQNPSLVDKAVGTSSIPFKNATDATAVKNRTPTPPRKQNSITRVPLRQQATSMGIEPRIGRSGTSGGALGHSFSSESGGSIRYSRSSFGTGRPDTPPLDLGFKGYGSGTATFETNFGRDEEEEDDDHTESSRILSPATRFAPTHGIGPYAKKASPVENFKKMAWGFFSRPLGTSTPCSDTGNKYVGYASSKYKRHSPSFDQATVRFFDTKKISPDISRWIAHAIVAFFALLFFTYIAKAHSETVSSGISLTAGFAVSSFRFLYNYAFIPIIGICIVGLFIFGIYKLASFRNYRKVEENRKLILLVERITDIIYESGTSGVAEPHVRDMIMPPTKRSEEEAKRWKEAARFINNEDSRIRTEIRLINGTECNVWIWVGAGKERWQGTALLEGSPMARVPEQALTRCLKLRGVNFSPNIVERDSIRNELLAKMRPIVPRHIGFVSGAESVVYIKLKNLSDAKDAFMAFHSHWFNGNLLSAKYVRDQRYLERFPEAEE
ncbi:hypothetical protein niasHS_003511 [Heterodera schachtii]|uniref:LEM domain-containing protein n=1 Tax=Heterodera schachtii TaxID=97005 RepID=A0ABD2KH25_HETSC